MKLSCNLSDAVCRDETIAALMSRTNVPGLGVAVIRDGTADSLFYHGIASPGTPVDAETVFSAASLTKPLFACLALRLFEEGLFDLDEPVVSMLPSPALSEHPWYRDITPRHCLSHSAGFPNWGKKPLPVAFRPGTEFSYSGEGFYFLQRALEARTGKGLPSLMEAYVFSPLAMRRSALRFSDSKNLCVGHDASGILYPPKTKNDDDPVSPEPNAAWSLYTTPADYAAFLRHVIHDRAGLSEDTFRDMVSPQNHATSEIPWGLGWGLVADAPSVLWHWGDNRGYKSQVVLDVQTGDGLVLMTNGDGGIDFCLSLCEMFTDGAFFPAVRAMIAHAEPA